MCIWGAGGGREMQTSSSSHRGWRCKAGREVIQTLFNTMTCTQLSQLFSSAGLTRALQGLGALGSHTRGPSMDRQKQGICPPWGQHRTQDYHRT